MSLTNRHHQPLQRYSSARSSSHPSPPGSNQATNLLISASETSGKTATLFNKSFVHKDVGDSGVDLSENGMTNSVQNLLSHPLAPRSTPTNLALPNSQDPLANHPFVGKTTSSPVPEQTSASNPRPTMIPLSAALSAPAPLKHGYYSEFPPNSSQSQQQGTPTLTISDEDEEDRHHHHQQQQQQHYNSEQNSQPIDTLLNEMNTSRRLQHFCSLRTRNTRLPGQQINSNTGSVSQYLAVDGNADAVRNTFIQPNSGMRGKMILGLLIVFILRLSFQRCSQMAKESSFT